MSHALASLDQPEKPIALTARPVNTIGGQREVGLDARAVAIVVPYVRVVTLNNL